MTSTLTSVPVSSQDLDLARSMCWAQVEVVCEVGDGGGLVVRVGGVFDAVSLPSALGAAVVAELGISLLGAPVLVDQDTQRWTLCTAPAAVAVPRVPSDLVGAGTRAVPRGEVLVVPVPTGGRWDGPRRWLSPPARGGLPPWTAVVGIARRVVDRGRR